MSTSKQDTDNQKLSIHEFAQREKIEIERFLEVSVSSRRDFKQRLIDELLSVLKPGDRLIISELSRLGRSVGQVIQICDELEKREIKFVALKEGLRFDGKPSIAQKAQLTLFSLFAEMERELNSERTKEGLAAARARGKKLGRPVGSNGKSMLDGREEEIKKFLAKRVANASLARILDCSENTLRNFCLSRGLVAKK